MMKKASQYHQLRGVTAAAVLVLAGLAGWEGFGKFKAHNLRERRPGSGHIGRAPHR